jgi:hypothetical protein
MADTALMVESGQHYLPNLPEDIDGSTGIPREVVGVRSGLGIALSDFQKACQAIDADPELAEITDQRYVTKKRGELKAVAAAKATREVERLERIVQGHEKVLADDAAKLTIGKGPDEATKAAVVTSFTALSRDERLAMLRAVENELAVPSRAADARTYLQSLLSANAFLNLIPSVITNGQSTRERLEASLKASLDPAGSKRINDSRTALQIAREASQRAREIIGGNGDARARMVRG